MNIIVKLRNDINLTVSNYDYLNFSYFHMKVIQRLVEAHSSSR